jgi:uncharacterized protein (DUF302 family)
MPVFATFTPPQPQVPVAERRGSLMMVLGTDGEHTPVLRHEPDAALQLPLAVWLREPATPGPTEVEFNDSEWLLEHAELPPELVPQVAALPELVEEALRG